MKKACQMLKQTQKGVNDIAYACGFSDPKYFSKVFRASIGLSPSDYRMEG
jgi:transcriptional regulator GlxA family with amidase domain